MSTSPSKRAAKQRPKLRIQPTSQTQIAAVQSDARDRLAKLEGWTQAPAHQVTPDGTPQNAPQTPENTERVGEGAPASENAATWLSASPERIDEVELQSKGRGGAVREPQTSPTKRAGGAKTPSTAKPTDGGMQMPWDAVEDGQIQPYYVRMPKDLHLKVDYCWKRSGYESMRNYVISALERAVEEDLKKLLGD